MDRRLTLACIAGAFSAISIGTPVLAQEYPSTVIRLVVPFAPGGASDQAARFLSGPLGEALGRSVIVENHAGAGGNIGIGHVANADPDGYTLLVASSAFVINPSISIQQNYDALEDFSFITQIGFSPNVLVAAAGSAIQNFDDLIAFASENPGDLFYSSAGVGTPTHLITELLKIEADIDLTHVPYQGAGPAAVAVLGGEVELNMNSLSAVLPYIQNGQLVPIVQTGSARSTYLPDTPTLVESGYPDAVLEIFQALFAPSGVPQNILDRLVETTVAVLEDPAMQESLAVVGFEMPELGPEALEARVTHELALWAEVIENAGIERQ